MSVSTYKMLDICLQILATIYIILLRKSIGYQFTVRLCVTRIVVFALNCTWWTLSEVAVK